ncbi:MAG: nucleoside phosphorylase [Oscillospiraceae bacterium]|nr:nucleoside phosphorylase [Oscillospiraceae bacterium]MDE7171639.1 nucleoside phosphorylase [Oscillospiraceae bacterium]
MSLFDTFDPNSEEIIPPSAMYRPVDGFPETIIMTFEEKSLQTLRDICDTQIVATLRGGWEIPVYKLSWKGRDIGVFQTLIGGAGTAGLLEEVLALGAKKVLLYGACGVLDAALAAGRFILPTQAYRDEGVSYHYLPAGDYVDVPTAERLGEVFDELKLPYVKGRVWTTDALYRETRSNMEKRRADGCVAVDMECASAMAVAQFRGAEVYEFFYAEDSLDGDAWDPRTLGTVPASDYEKYLRVALEAAARL